MKSFERAYAILFLLAGGMTMLAGCQAEDVRFKLSDQRVPEQVGLRLEWIRDFGRDGSLASQPTNLGRYYVEQGELHFRYFRVTNTSAESRDLYPTVEGGESAFSLTQYYTGVCPRSSYDCPIFPQDPILPIAEVLSSVTSAYRSDFDIRGVEFVFESGGRESVKTETGNPKPITLRAGESAVVQFRLGLHRGFSVHSSAAVGEGVPAGQGFFPPDLQFNPYTRFERTEWLLGAVAEGTPVITLLDRNPLTDELNPIYFETPKTRRSLFPENSASVRSVFPPASVAQTINGLAVQM
jgi:hypothetical protein